MRFITTITLFTLLKTIRCQESSFHFQWFYLKSESVIEIKISSPVTDSPDLTQRYVAVAFAIDPVMQDGDGYYCANGTLKSISLTSLYAEPTVLQTTSGAELKSFSIKNKRISCTFNRPIRVKKTISGGREYDFNFDMESYHILLATGDISGGEITYHDKREVRAAVDFSAKITDVINPIDGTVCNLPGFKNCLQEPAGCSPTKPDCTFFSLKQMGDSIEIELSGRVGNGQAYVAVAFGKTGNMEDADMYYCDGKSSRSGVIRKRHEQPVDLNDESLRLISASTINGVGQCIFSRPLCVRKEVSNGVRMDFDFFAGKLFMLLAHGSMSEGGKMEQHDERVTTKGSHKLAHIEVPYECVNVDFGPLTVSTSPCSSNKPGSLCLRHPENCYPSSPDCMFASFEEEKTNFNFEISGGKGNGEEYIALGFVADQVTILFYCDGRELKYVIMQDEGWNEAAMSDPVIMAGVEAATTYGIGHCRFSMPACVIRKLPNGKNYEFDILKDEYQVIVSKGDIKGGKIDYQPKNSLVYDTSQPLGAVFDANYTCVEEEVKDGKTLIAASKKGSGNSAEKLTRTHFLTLIFYFLLTKLA